MGDVKENSYQDFTKYEDCNLGKLVSVTRSLPDRTTSRLHSIGIIPMFQIEHNHV